MKLHVTIRLPYNDMSISFVYRHINGPRHSVTNDNNAASTSAQPQQSMQPTHPQQIVVAQQPQHPQQVTSRIIRSWLVLSVGVIHLCFAVS